MVRCRFRRRCNPMHASASRLASLAGARTYDPVRKAFIDSLRSPQYTGVTNTYASGWQALVKDWKSSLTWQRCSDLHVA